MTLNSGEWPLEEVVDGGVGVMMRGAGGGVGC